MKYHKINGIEKTVCTVEQKIAYNLAFESHISYQDEFDKSATVSGVCVSELVSDIIRQIIKRVLRDPLYNPSKMDLDAIQAALNAGLENYLRSPFIASSFEQIGAAFPAYYL